MIYTDSELADFLTKKFSFLTPYEMKALMYRFEDECCDMYEGYLDYVKDVIGADGYDTGCTKLVWFFDEFPDVVIKIPFVGYGCVDNYLKSNGIDIESAITNRFINLDNIDMNGFDFYTFTEANYDNIYNCKKNDYCSAESFVYDEAVKANVNEAFAFTKYFMDINNVPIYVSQRIDAASSRVHSKSEVVRYSAETLKAEHICARLDDVDIENVVIDYGFKFAKQLLNFLDKLDINDLSYSNLGASEDGKFKIIDYASYREED